MTRVPDWGMIGRWAVLSSLIAALVLFFVVPDQRWIAAVFVGVALIDGLIFWVLMPRLQGGGSGGAPSLSDLERHERRGRVDRRPTTSGASANQATSSERESGPYPVGA